MIGRVNDFPPLNETAPRYPHAAKKIEALESLDYASMRDAR